MKKFAAWCFCGAAALAMLSGCTSVESTQKFNAVNLGSGILPRDAGKMGVLVK